MEQFVLSVPSGKSTVTIGFGAKERLKELGKGVKKFVVTDKKVYALYRDFFTEYFSEAEVFLLPSSEKAKNFPTLYKILCAMERAGLNRSSCLFAVGGGVVGDIAGLAAALYMRGIDCVQVPTTLLSQVDSALGGKTAVNLGKIKNFAGAFYQPKEIVVDTEFLRTLPIREVKSGLGEVVKYAALSESILTQTERKMSEMNFKDGIDKLVYDCLKWKADVVMQDERDEGIRRQLNIGHTSAHAIERTGNLTHGESVLIGLLFETNLAEKRGVCESSYAERLKSLVRKALSFPSGSKLSKRKLLASVDVALYDKKNPDDGITAILPVAVGKWQAYTLPFEEYKTAFIEFVEDEYRKKAQNEGNTAD